MRECERNYWPVPHLRSSLHFVPFVTSLGSYYYDITFLSSLCCEANEKSEQSTGRRQK